MAATSKDKTCRMDIRLTQDQRNSYEQAAALRGQTLTQWTTQHLDECARRDIDQARTTALEAAAFQSFCDMLDAPMPKPAVDLLAREEIWA